MAINKERALKLGREALVHLQSTDPDMLEWARNIGPNTFRNLRLRQFLWTYCWVVYATGFRYTILEAIFPDLQKAFKDFDPKALSRMRSINPVLKIFNNKRKAMSFLLGTKAIIEEGFVPFKRRLSKEGIQVLAQLPGIGRITKDQLARNIGFADLAKADIWLERATTLCEAASVDELVSFIAKHLRESKGVIDVAIWAYGKDGQFQHFSSMTAV